MTGLNSRISESEIIKRLCKNNSTLEKVVYEPDKGCVVYYRCRKHPETVQKILRGNLTARYGCALCSASKGERKIRAFLKEHKINFEEQKIFNGCKFKNNLRFDFYLPLYNICIEYQGAQHYFSPISWGKHFLTPQKQEEEFNLIQTRDQIKRDFCKNNNIQLLEISYKNYNKIETILQEEVINGVD